MPWEIDSTTVYDEWFAGLARGDQIIVVARVSLLMEHGPGLGRPTVDSVQGSRHSNMKELRGSSIRVLFAFDPERRAILLIGGDKRDEWQAWYDTNIPIADALYDRHLAGLRPAPKRKRGK